MKLCSVTFHSQVGRASPVPSITGIFSTILHIQLVYVQCVGGGSLLHAVLLPMGEHSWALQPGHLAVQAGCLTGQGGLVSFNGLLTFQLLLEQHRWGCQKHHYLFGWLVLELVLVKHSHRTIPCTQKWHYLYSQLYHFCNSGSLNRIMCQETMWCIKCFE